MAGDWIKMRVDLISDPAVVRMASELTLDRFAVVGRLLAVWAWADAHADATGAVALVSHDWIDALSQTAGFARAMQAVGWLAVEGDGLRFPRFDRHMGAGAKARANATLRQKRSRAARTSDKSRPTADPVTKPSRSRHAPVTPLSQESVTREEKRREEIEDPPTPPSGGTAEDPSTTAADPPAPRPRKRTADQPRPRNPLFDALADVTGSDPALNGKLLGKVSAALAAASPPYGPDDVRQFGRRFAEICPWGPKDGRNRPTPGEVQNHIGKIRAAKARPPDDRPRRTVDEAERDLLERDPPLTAAGDARRG